MPHMHLRGKSFTYDAEYPDGTRKCCSTCPITTSIGSSLHARRAEADAQGDPAGHARPISTTRPRTWPTPIRPEASVGDQTWEEMMIGFYTSVDPKEDRTAGKVAGQQNRRAATRGGDSSATARAR